MRTLRILGRLCGAGLLLWIACWMMPKAAFVAALPNIAVNGVTLPSEVQPYYTNGRVMAPVAALAQRMGAQIEWTETTGDIFMYLGGRYAWVQASNPTMYYGNYVVDERGNPLLTGVSAIPLDARPDLTAGRAFAPLAALAEALGGTVAWDESANTARVTLPAYAPVPVRGGGTAMPAPEQIVPDANAAGMTLPDAGASTDATLPDASAAADAFGETLPDASAAADAALGNPAREPAIPAFAADNTPALDAAAPLPSYFRLLDIATVLQKYEADDPFVLLCFNNRLHTAALRETLRAAADAQLMVYGFDNAYAGAALPFGYPQASGDHPWLYFIHDSETVESLNDFDHAQINGALLDYWAG